MTAKEIQEQAKMEQRKYKKAWREKNPDKVKKHQADYWKRKAAKTLEARTKLKENSN